MFDLWKHCNAAHAHVKSFSSFFSTWKEKGGEGRREGEWEGGREGKEGGQVRGMEKKGEKDGREGEREGELRKYGRLTLRETHSLGLGKLFLYNLRIIGATFLLRII